MAAALHGDRNQKEIIQLLLDHGADPSIRNLDNDQPIHMAPSGKAGDQVRVPAAPVPSAFNGGNSEDVVCQQRWPSCVAWG